jgi:hypothetical protein
MFKPRIKLKLRPPPSPVPSKWVEILLTKLKLSFDPSTDLLLISEREVEEAKRFDTEGWIESIAPHSIVLSNDLSNIAIVRAGFKPLF